jgi:prepilin-type N-terminal cleavage/methylation domain-containing protein
MNNNNKKGFTLIELLVVIAIIGILSGTVIVSMSGVQSTAKDARIKSGIGQLRIIGETYKHGVGLGYSYVDPDDGAKNFINNTDQATQLIAEVNAQGGTAVVTFITDDKWCASKQLTSDASQYACVDYRGFTSIGASVCSISYICE